MIASPRTWPGVLTVVPWWHQHGRTIVVVPPLMPFASFNARVGQIHARGVLSDHRETGDRGGTHGQEILGTRLLVHGRRPDGKPGQDALRVNRSEQVNAIKPAEAVRAANLGNTSQPRPLRRLLRAFTPTCH